MGTYCQGKVRKRKPLKILTSYLKFQNTNTHSTNCKHPHLNFLRIFLFYQIPFDFITLIFDEVKNTINLMMKVRQSYCHFRPLVSKYLFSVPSSVCTLSLMWETKLKVIHCRSYESTVFHITIHDHTLIGRSSQHATRSDLKKSHHQASPIKKVQQKHFNCTL